MYTTTLLPLELRTESLLNPIGLDTPAPRLSWTLQSLARGQVQSAYQVLAASRPDLLDQDSGDLWDSGRVESDASVHVAYAGKPLVSHQPCFWKVRVWNGDGAASDWSTSATWTLGILSSADWQAKWIALPAEASGIPDQTDPEALQESASPWFRKTMTLDTVPQRALVYVNAVGYYELHINGQKVGGDALSPAVSVLPRRTWVVAYDVTEYLNAGKNTLGLWMGRGWNAKTVQGPDCDERPRARVQAHLQFSGASLSLGTDASWKGSPSSLVTLGSWEWNRHVGERQDARLDNPDWCHPRLDDSAWMPVEVLPDLNVPATALLCPLNRIGKRIPSIRCTTLAEGRYELDFGTALTGRLHMRMPQLREGTAVRMYFADWKYHSTLHEHEVTGAGTVRKNKSDMLFPETSGGSFRYQVFNQLDDFIAGGREGEEFLGRFNYHGFRYVILEGLTEHPGNDSATAELIETDLESTGSFACSNGLINQIHSVNLWTIRCLNLNGFIVDCPHRERLGYGDGQVSIQTAVMNQRADQFYAKWLQDWIDTQSTNGALPFSTPYHSPLTPGQTDFGREGPPAWGGTLPVLAWTCALYYDDVAALQTAYEPMRRFLHRLDALSENKILRGFGDRWQRLGDWVPPGGGLDCSANWPAQPANDLFNNCYLLYLLDLQVKAAKRLGKEEDVRFYSHKIEQLRPLIHKEFYDTEQQIYVNEEQASLVMPLMAGVVPEDLHGMIFAKLEQSILHKRSGHVDTGMLGTHFLIQYLNCIGRDDLIYAFTNHSTYPGWGYMISQGATTFWEQWNGFWSKMHSCFTSIAGWFHAGLAGIQPDPDVPGFKKIHIKPAVVGDLEWVRCRHNSNYGVIESNWRRDGNCFELEVFVPPNTTATVHIPAADPGKILESGNPLDRADAVRILRQEEGLAVLEVGSGRYLFSLTL